MSLLACSTHWYVSALFVVPVLIVGAWGWWSSRRSTAERESDGPATRDASVLPETTISDRPAY